MIMRSADEYANFRLKKFRFVHRILKNLKINRLTLFLQKMTFSRDVTMKENRPSNVGTKLKFSLMNIDNELVSDRIRVMHKD